FAQLPFEIIPQEIIQTQSTNVDIISGTTRTSYGIIMAVEDALNKARIECSQTSQN
ncbi:MAG TPA: FMN-binding protein, partial [Thermoanaerobacter sp.]|nr:FMN-binding protein [Thermoanaerobacter sp.]